MTRRPPWRRAWSSALVVCATIATIMAVAGAAHGQQQWPPPGQDAASPHSMPPAGHLSPEEATPPERSMRHYAWLRLGALLPLGEGYVGSDQPGVAVDFAYWFEGRYFAIDVRLGLHGDALRDRTFGELPIDASAYGLLPLRYITLFLGVGGGARYVWATIHNNTEWGRVIPTRMTEQESDAGWGPALAGRAGLLVGRGWTARFTVHIDYNVTFLSLLDFKNPAALTAGAGVMF